MTDLVIGAVTFLPRFNSPMGPCNVISDPLGLFSTERGGTFAIPELHDQAVISPHGGIVFHLMVVKNSESRTPLILPEDQKESICDAIARTVTPIVLLKSDKTYRLELGDRVPFRLKIGRDSSRFRGLGPIVCDVTFCITRQWYNNPAQSFANSPVQRAIPNLTYFLGISLTCDAMHPPSELMYLGSFQYRCTHVMNRDLRRHGLIQCRTRISHRSVSSASTPERAAPAEITETKQTERPSSLPPSPLCFAMEEDLEDLLRLLPPIEMTEEKRKRPRPHSPLDNLWGPEL